MSTGPTMTGPQHRLDAVAPGSLDAGELPATARGGLTNLGGAGFTAAAGLAVTWLAARALGPATAGVFFAAVAAFVLVAGVAKLGTPTGLVYWVARLRARGRPELVGACLRAGTLPVAVTATGLGVGLWLAAPWLATTIAGRGAGAAGAAATATGVLRTLAVFLPLAALADALLAATRGFRLMRPTVALDKLVRPGLQLLGVTALATMTLWTAVPLSAWALAWALPYLPCAVLAGYALHLVHRRHTLAVPVRTGLPTAWAAARTGLPTAWAAAPPAADAAPVRAAFWRFTWPRAVASVLQLALQRLDILLVAALAGPVPAAIYTVAGRFVVLGQLANQAIGYAAQPRLAERLSVADRAGAGILYQGATAWLVLTTWPLYLLVIGYAPVYLGVFGGSYRSGGTVVVVLATAMLLATACGMVDTLLAMAGRTSWNLLNVSIALATMVVVDLALIPRLGALGAAIGLASAVAVNNLLPLAQIGYALRLHPFGTGTLIAAGMAAGCFGILPALARTVAGTGPVAVTGTLAAATALYLAGARQFRHRLALIPPRRPRVRLGDPHA